MHLFLCDNTSMPYATLNAEESKHCVRVLRMQMGDELWVTAGDGVMCRCRLYIPDDKACQVEILERLPNYDRRTFHLHVAIAPTKNIARTEWFVEKAVEMGIDRITPIICDHSERGTLRDDRLVRIALSAMKQSLKATHPMVDSVTRLSDFLSHHATGDNRYICHCDGDERHTLHECYRAGQDAVVLIGPEGDFSPQEVQSALAAGFQPVTLGNCRLRTETAALYAVTALNFMNEQP